MGALAGLHVTRWGSGTPVVFLHGLGASGRYWDELRRLGKENYAGVAVDLLGYDRVASERIVQYARVHDGRLSSPVGSTRCDDREPALPPAELHDAVEHTHDVILPTRTRLSTVVQELAELLD